MALLT
ncbi:hypothetical protein R3I93_006165 [Phoxinus phoxinus]|jgi:hypothetical protein